MFLDKVSIKKLIFLNSALIFSIVLSATIFLFLSNTSIKKRLSHLTTHSTPFQIKTIQAEAKIQGLTTVLTKMISSESRKELEQKMESLNAILEELKWINKELTEMSEDSRIKELIDSFTEISEAVFIASAERIDAELRAKEATAEMSLKIKEITKKLHAFDAQIKQIQSSSSKHLFSSKDAVINASDSIKGVYEVFKMLQHVDVSFNELRRAENKTALDLAKSKFSLAINKALHIDFFRAKDREEEVRKLYNRLKDIEAMALGKDGLVDSLYAYLITKGDDIKKKIDTQEKQVSTKIRSLSGEISTYIDVQFQDINFSTSELEKSINLSLLSNDILLLSSELTSKGYSIEVDAARLLLAHDMEEMSTLVHRLSANFSIVEDVIKKLSGLFLSLQRKDGVLFLQTAATFFDNIKQTLIGRDGLSKKIEKVFYSHQNTLALSQQLEKIVSEQQLKSRAMLTAASEEQKKAAISVNTLITHYIIASLLLGLIIIAIGITVGIISAKTINSSISQITKVSDAIAQGDFSQNIKPMGPPEIRSLVQSFITMKDDLKDRLSFKRSIEGAKTVEEVYLKLEDVFKKRLEINDFLIFEALKNADSMNLMYRNAAKAGYYCNNNILTNSSLCKAKETGNIISPIEQYQCSQFINNTGKLYLCIPHIIEGNVISVMQIIFDKQEQKRLKKNITEALLYIDAAMPVVEAKRLQCIFKEASLKDEMTGFYNRRFLSEYVQTLTSNVFRKKTIAGLLIGDIDFFKKINDVYGHYTGDMVIRDTAAIIKENLRGSDIVIRFGGEEFLIILIDIREGDAEIVAEKIRNQIESAIIQMPGCFIQRTISIGISEFPKDTEDFWEAVRFADTALYNAKRTGRNKTARFIREMLDEKAAI